MPLPSQSLIPVQSGRLSLTPPHRLAFLILGHISSQHPVFGLCLYSVLPKTSSLYTFMTFLPLCLGLSSTFPNSQSIHCAPILTDKHSTYWYYTVLNFPGIIHTHNRMIGLGQSYKRVLKCYFLCVKGPKGRRQGLSHFLFPPLWVKMKTCKLTIIFGAYYMLKLYQRFTDQLG